MLLGIGGIIICVCAHACSCSMPGGLGHLFHSFRPLKKNLHQITQTCHSIFKLCSPTANRRFIPCIHSHLDHAHMHDRPFPPSQFHMQSRAAEIANICLENERRGQTVTRRRTLLGSFTYVWTVARFAWLRNSPHCCTMQHFEYFISFIIYQLWKIKSTYNGCNLRERKRCLWCAACWQWCIGCTDSKSTNCHTH